MLESILGVRMLLMVGPTIPLPAPPAVTSAMVKAQVTSDAERGDGFQLTFTLGKDTIVDYGLLLQGVLDPFNRVVIGVLFGAMPEVLIDGIITHQQMQPSNDPGMARLTVTGRDVSVMLNLEEKNEEYPNQPDFLIATRIIAQYAQYGLLPQVTPTLDVPIMLQRIPRQHETDLAFIQRMARRNGYVFYIEPETVGVNRAYWGPENRLSIPQPALTMNMGAATNTSSLSFAQNALAPVESEGSFVEPITRTSIPIPSLPSLRVPPLAAMPTRPRRKVLMRQTANENPARAATSALAAVTNTPDAVVGQGTLDAARYGHALRARQLVGVRGVGFNYDGLYYVRRVTHSLERGKYEQQFVISREGTGSLLPVVRP